MKLISFFADVDGGTYYSQAAKNLIRECKSLGVDHSIEEKHFGDSWIDNVRAKPIFLLSMLERLNEPFVWLDCDCHILKPLDFRVKSDWGIYLREDGTPHDFVHYVDNSNKTRAFIKKWINTINEQKQGSHTAFISIFKELDSEVMPPGYFELGLAETESKESYFASKN